MGHTTRKRQASLLTPVLVFVKLATNRHFRDLNDDYTNKLDFNSNTSNKVSVMHPCLYFIEKITTTIFWIKA